MSEPDSAPVFDPGAILTTLERHKVQYVVVGGFAAALHGATRPTSDVDVTPAMDRANLDRLAAALNELGARVRTDDVPGGLPVAMTGHSLMGRSMLNLTTVHGDIDLAITPSAFPGGYDDLAPRAGVHHVATIQVRVAALTDVIASKEAAARAKDQRALPELRALAGLPPSAARRSCGNPTTSTNAHRALRRCPRPGRQLPGTAARTPSGPQPGPLARKRRTPPLTPTLRRNPPKHIFDG